MSRRQRKSYRVTVEMSVVLCGEVRARSADEAIAKAEALAASGELEELENSGDLHGWNAREMAS